MQGINEYNQIHINGLNTICKYQNLHLIFFSKIQKITYKVVLNLKILST